MSFITMKEYINTKIGIWKGIHFMNIGYSDDWVEDILCQLKRKCGNLMKMLTNFSIDTCLTIWVESMNVLSKYIIKFHLKLIYFNE